MMPFVRTVLIMRAKATQAYCNEEFRNFGTILFIQSIVENVSMAKALLKTDTSPTFPLNSPLPSLP